MRVLLALLALVGLLLSPVAASAATQVCLHHDAGAPVKHDKTSCAQACAVICGMSVALTQTAADVSLSESHARVEPAAPSPLHAHAPPGLKRPPTQDA